MKKGTCYIVGAGDMTSRNLQTKNNDLLIAADGGYLHLSQLGLRPDFVIGDMDSFHGQVIGVPLLRFPVRKDDTDLSLALKLGRKIGYNRFKIYGASGGQREDHFIAALQLMGGWSKEGYSLQLIAPHYTIYTLTDSCLLLTQKAGYTISVFSHSANSLGVSLKGLSYEARNISLGHSHPLGVSNAIGPSGRAVICVKKGTLLIYAAHRNIH
ncbi:MAG: thiamine diphosphokinase [Clostridiales bacterium]|nr:thiamine diphosphokinase [Clostridiales bacterium]